MGCVGGALVGQAPQDMPGQARCPRAAAARVAAAAAAAAATAVAPPPHVLLQLLLLLLLLLPSLQPPLHAPTGPHSSTGSPMTLMMRPRVPRPTGTCKESI